MKVMRTMAVLTASAVVAAACQTKGSSAAPGPSANGIAALSGEQILQRAAAAVTKAGSFRLTTDIDDVSQGKHLVIDIKVAGEDLIGSCTIDEARVKVLVIAEALYLKPDEPYWTAVLEADPERGRQAAVAAGNRWNRFRSG